MRARRSAFDFGTSMPFESAQETMSWQWYLSVLSEKLLGVSRTVHSHSLVSVFILGAMGGRWVVQLKKRYTFVSGCAPWKINGSIF